MFLPSHLIALYARLSKDRSGLSENAQIQFAEGLEFVEDGGGQVSLKFKDNDISASKFSKKPRDEYDKLIAAIKRGEVEYIVVTEMTRLYRRIEELLDLIKLAETTRLRGIWTTDGIGYDLSTPEGIHAAIGAVNNAMLESAKISKRQKRKKKAQAQAGLYLGGKKAYGYEGPIRDENDVIINRGRINIAVIEDEKENWLKCVDRVIAGEPQLSIVHSMNKKGIPSPEGKEWAIGNFKRTLTLERYVIFDPEDQEQHGTLVHNGTAYRAAWPGFISREKHELLLARFRDAAAPWASRGQPKGRSYLLTGFTYCGRCGNAARGGGRQLPNRYQRRYNCRPRDNHGAIVGCGKIFRDAEALDAFVTEAVLYRFDSPEVNRALTPTDDRSEVNQLIRTLTEHRQRRSVLLREYSLGEHTKADFDFMRDTLDAEIESTQTALGKLQDANAAAILPTEGALREHWEANEPEWRRTVIKLLVEKVVIHPSRPGGATWNGRRFDPACVEIVWLH
ncbi:recombinase family protein [Kribbella monticola]|uniref:recombinase family protein n=1 Tax=Kribbella monticola TaxID=2185285 RepID=UPI000DD4719F|nr:recombinase family protein [Kribbella monticola]